MTTQDYADSPKRFICANCGCAMIREGVGDDMTYRVAPVQTNVNAADDPDLAVRCVFGGFHVPSRIGVNA